MRDQHQDPCPHCGKPDLIKKGKRKTKTRSLVQRWQCKSCRRATSLGGPYLRRLRTPDRVVMFILAEHIAGKSSRNISKDCWDMFEHKISHSVIIRMIVLIRRKINVKIKSH